MAVLTGEFLCPQCQAKLRINQRGKDSAQILCPECSEPIQIRLSSSGKLSAGKLGAEDKNSPQEDLPLWEQKKSHNMPVYVGGFVLLGLLLSGLWWGMSSENDSPETTDTHVTKSSKDDHKSQKEPQLSSPLVITEESPDQKDESKEESPFAKNLKLLGQQVDTYQHQNAQFPPALWMPEGEADSSKDRFSWLAGLDAALAEDRSLLPQWNLSWRDPLNDRFVRRRRKELLNPAIRLQASPDRYPASHIVGIAGVGHDAPQLPVSDPRAGIFGVNRLTKVEDVTDGLSNTMLAAGITGKLSSWADGMASFRPIVLEPYINGPDGFGSGQKQGMYVLMADGSVRFLNKKIEPTIIRRMAAMADALPLDASVPGEPGTKSIVIATNPEGDKPEQMKSKEDQPQPAAPEEKKESNNPEALPVPAPVESIPEIDFEKALSRKVLQFELKQPASLETVLVELEAMVGIRIDFDKTQIPAEDPIRKKKVSFSKRNVSFKQLLSELIKPAALQYEVRKDHIAIVKGK